MFMIMWGPIFPIVWMQVPNHACTWLTTNIC